MNNEFLLEIGTEEIPAGYIMPALGFMQETLAKKLADLSLPHGAITTAATPRRLTLCVGELAVRQADRREEVMGPPKKAAFDADNKPTKAAIGFAASRGATVDDIRVVNTPKGEYLMLVQEHKGELTRDLLARLLPEFILSIPFPKSMRWGAFRAHFARPIQWLMALFGGEVVEFSINDMPAGESSRGHRFMAPQSTKITDFSHYLGTLRAQKVIADVAERKRMIRAEAERAAAAVGGTIVADEELLDTITNLVEYPVGVTGAFERKFLELPPEVLITSMRVHQKYFTVSGADGKLMANFVAINNTAIADPLAAAAGHQRVLRARLEDALFFYREDGQRTLEERRADLAGVVFQAQLGTMLDKTERIEALARFLCQQIDAQKVDIVGRAAHLAKTDLVTGMVGEFPTLQGVMGKYYALREGESREVAVAIEEHYLPLRSGSSVPTGIAGAIVSMADRLDTIAGCFGIGKTPTGATDPYGLRRHALALIHIIASHRFSLSLRRCVDFALQLYGKRLSEDTGKAAVAIIDFIRGRYMNDLIAAGIPQGAVDAVLAPSFDDIVDCRSRIDALVAVSGRETFTLLAGAFKRVINIIKEHAETSVNSELFREEEERALHEVLLVVEQRVDPLVSKGDYEKALEEILAMKDPVDAFFDKVMVMCDDAALKANRLALLTAISKLFLRVGDFSRMSTMAARE